MSITICTYEDDSHEIPTAVEDLGDLGDDMEEIKNNVIGDGEV